MLAWDAALQSVVYAGYYSENIRDKSMEIGCWREVGGWS